MDRAPRTWLEWRLPKCLGTLARDMAIQRDSASAEAALLTIRLATVAPTLMVARDLLDHFHAMIRIRRRDLLDGWIAVARESRPASFVSRITSDHAVVRAAITEPWSNGQVEGQITKLALVMRQAYGRAKPDLRRARLVGAS